MDGLGTLSADDNTVEIRVDDTVEQLVVPAAAPSSLETLYAEHAESLVRALQAAGYPDAHDAVQEAFVQAVVHWRKVSRYDDPLAWVRRVAINRGINRRRARRRQAAVTERVAATSPATVPERVERDDELTALIESLPPQQRLALSLYYFADLTVAEVADAMDLSPGTVKFHLHAARTSLARSLDAPRDF